MAFANKKLIGLILVSATLGTSLSGCFPVLVGGAMVGTMMAIDRRTAGTQVEDERIELRGASLIRTNIGDRVHVNLVSFNRRVLLTGEVPSLQDRQLVEQIVSRVENVQAVVNELAVLGSPSLTQRSADALITGRVKAALLDARDLYVSAFKVVTERGTVYLMGLVTQRESERATDIARATPGVQKVVRVFEIMSEEELRVLLPPPAPKK